MSPLDFIHPEDQKRAVDNWIETVSAEGRPAPRIARGTGAATASGGGSSSRTTSAPQEDDAFEIVSEMVDISEEMAMHEALRVREEFLRRLTSSLPVAVGQIDPTGAILNGTRRGKGKIAKIRFLISRDSTTASTTRSAPLSSSIEVAKLTRSCSAFASSSLSLPRETARAVECSRC